MARPRPFANDIALWGASIIKKDSAEAAGADGGQSLIGSGPFMLDSWEKGSADRPEEEPPLLGEGRRRQRSCPYLDQVNLIVLTDDNTRMLQAAGGRDRHGAGRAVQPDRSP